MLIKYSQKHPQDLLKTPQELPKSSPERPRSSLKHPQSTPRRPQRVSGPLQSAQRREKERTSEKKRPPESVLARIRAPILRFFATLLSRFALSLLRVVFASLLLFDVASVLRAFVASASRCSGRAQPRANEGHAKPLGAESTNSVIRATMQKVNR